MKTAVMYGAGNIGRGFLGQLFYESGYHTVFIDVNEELAAALNRRGSYPLRLLSGDGINDLLIGNVRAVHGHDAEAVANTVASADLMAVAVGANVLPHIAPRIAMGLRRRLGGRPLDILVCENLKDAGLYFRRLLRDCLPAEAHGWFEASVGLVDTSIGRMVPLQTETMRDGDPLRVCAEPYKDLPADRDAFRAGIPELQGLAPYAPFSFYTERKLYLHNMGHALTAYYGDSLGQEYIWQAIETPEVLGAVRGAMRAAAGALAKRHNACAGELNNHVDDLVKRFANRQLGDTVYRVGRDLRRKLAPDDRLVGALRLCREAGADTSGLARGIALALRSSMNDLGMPPERALAEVCGIQPEEPVFSEILGFSKLSDN
jgi:mannitol-1-phosphate 5-dehydrogenase